MQVTEFYGENDTVMLYTDCEGQEVKLTITFINDKQIKVVSDEIGPFGSIDSYFNRE